MNKAWKITLADGSVIGGLGLNGNNFVSQTEVTPDMFRGKLSRVTIDGPEDADDMGLRGEHGQMKLVQIVHYDDDEAGLNGWYFVLQDVQAAELDKLRGDIEYLAMMAGVEL